MSLQHPSWRCCSNTEKKYRRPWLHRAGVPGTRSVFFCSLWSTRGSGRWQAAAATVVFESSCGDASSRPRNSGLLQLYRTWNSSSFQDFTRTSEKPPIPYLRVDSSVVPLQYFYYCFHFFRRYHCCCCCCSSSCCKL